MSVRPFVCPTLPVHTTKDGLQISVNISFIHNAVGSDYKGFGVTYL